MRPDIWHEPKTLERFPFKDGAEVWVVNAPYPMARDRPEIIGTFITLGGDKAWKVLGVERYMLATPIRKDEKIGLVVKPTTMQELPVSFTGIYTGDGQKSRAFPIHPGLTIIKERKTGD